MGKAAERGQNQFAESHRRVTVGQPSRDEVWRVLREIVSQVVERPEIALQEGTRLKEDLELMSVQAVEIQVALEDLFDLELDQSELVVLATLGDLLAYLLGEIRHRLSRPVAPT